MSPDIDSICVDPEAPLQKALAMLDQSGTRFLAVIAPDKTLQGVVTDGDIRRALLRGVGMQEPIRSIMVADCVRLPVEATDAEINSALSGRIYFVPLVDKAGRVVDYAATARHHRYPVMEPLLQGNELDYVQECVRTGWISSQGRFVPLFEKMMADYHGCEFALAVSNGTAALHLALASLGIGPGDEVIVPDFTFGATASTVIHANATPVFVDVDPVTWTMDAAAVERALSPRTKAIVPVHIYGHPCDMGPLLELAKAKNLLVVEDCAEAVGAKYRGTRVGTMGNTGCFSFFGNKIITTGEGGIVLFRDRAVYERAKMLRDHGMTPARRYWHLEPGYNYRLTNLQAAVGVAQMERIDEILERKRRLFRRYQSALTGVPGLRCPAVAEWADPVCWLYTLAIEDSLGLSRDELAQRLLANGVETRPVFLPLHQMPAYRTGRSCGPFPVTEELARCGLSIPSSVRLEDKDIEFVATRLLSIAKVRQMVIGARSVA